MIKIINKIIYFLKKIKEGFINCKDETKTTIQTIQKQNKKQEI